METSFVFLKNYCVTFTKTYWVLKNEEVLNLTIVALFSFL